MSFLAMASSVALMYFPLFGVLYILAISTYSLMLTLRGIVGKEVISASPNCRMMRSIRAMRFISHLRVLALMSSLKYSCPIRALCMSFMAKSRSVSLLYSGMSGSVDILSSVKRLMVLSTKVSMMNLSSFQ